VPALVILGDADADIPVPWGVAPAAGLHTDLVVVPGARRAANLKFPDLVNAAISTLRAMLPA
jgi:pimeloyl-ACP methyl ester carboxylesterase